MDSFEQEHEIATGIAIVGMACRFPGASNPDTFWENIRTGVESILTLDREELLRNGVSESQIDDRCYVGRCAVLDGYDRFDAGFFGYSPLEASIMDPQHRQFLECAWESLESAGYDPSQYEGSIGVYAGSGYNTYLARHLLPNEAFVQQHGFFLLRHTANDKDFLSTTASYKFDLKGPSINIQTACSTSLVAVHAACQSLQGRECDMALAGGVTIELPQGQGYLYAEGEILSPDGHCRPFDAEARGTVFGSGVGVVVLKRLQDAIDAGDTIFAVIKATAVNNDGSEKVSYLAPSVKGQAAAITEALGMADVEPDTIGFVECHGTGTPMGDPVEVAALSEAFGLVGARAQYCALGSVKANIGHLDTAAGVAALIKAAQIVRYGEIPPMVNFSSHMSAIKWAQTPFYVPDSLRSWASPELPRRACVNSLGVGGTNAHVVLEQAPEVPLGQGARDCQLVVISARNERTLESARLQLVNYLEKHRERLQDREAFADVTYTLGVGRKSFSHRAYIVAQNVDDAILQLQDLKLGQVSTKTTKSMPPKLVFMFAGGGSQYPGMGRDLYQTERVYRESVDLCLNLLDRHIDFDLRELLFPDSDRHDWAANEMRRPSRSVVSLFVTQYSLSQLFQSWGIAPEALVGHSLGENTAACLAGVFSLSEALGLVALRGKLFEKVEAITEGGMLSVQLPLRELQPLLSHELDIAAHNGEEMVVVSGPDAALSRLEATLNTYDHEHQRVRIRVAAHSRYLEPVLEEFRMYTHRMQLNVPAIPIMSNVTGEWLTDAQATDPDYWVRHLRQTVLFSQGIANVLATGPCSLVEVGPGRAMSSLTRASTLFGSGHQVVQSMRTDSDPSSDVASILLATGQLWQNNVNIKWPLFYDEQTRKRTPLPTYPFERERYWIDPPARGKGGASLERSETPEDWLHQPVWNVAPRNADNVLSGVLLLVGTHPLVDALAALLADLDGVRCLRVDHDIEYQAKSNGDFSLDILQQQHWTALFSDLAARGQLPNNIVYCASLNVRCESVKPAQALFENGMDLCFSGLLLMLQAGLLHDAELALRLFAVTDTAVALPGDDDAQPLGALVTGPVAVVAKEASGIHARHIDVQRIHPNRTQGIAATVVEELRSERPNGVTIAIRRGISYERGWSKFPGRASTTISSPANLVSANARTVLITGGMGGIGLEAAAVLAAQGPVNLILLGRSDFPARREWPALARQRGAPAEKAQYLLGLEEKGAHIEVCTGDVTSLADMRQVESNIRARFGVVDFVIHGAGSIDDDLLLLKTPEASARVIAPKVLGLLHLLDVFKAHPITDIWLFSSSSSFAGLKGQIDYVSANAVLDAVALSGLNETGTQITAINWPAWRDTGMAMRAATQALVVSAQRIAVHPWLGTVTECSDEISFLTYFRCDEDWVLAEHTVIGVGSVLPGTAYIELARAACVEASSDSRVRMKEVSFLTPCVVPANESVPVRTTLRATNGQREFIVSSYRAGSWIENARGLLAPFGEQQANDFPTPRLVLSAFDGAAVEHYSDEDHPGLVFGPRWQCVDSICVKGATALLRVVLPPEYSADVDVFGLHPAMLDLATAGAQRIVPMLRKANAFFAPLAYGEIIIKSSLPAQFSSYVVLRGSPSEATKTRDLISFDVMCFSDDGDVIVLIKDFTMRYVDANGGAMRMQNDTQVDRTSALHHVMSMGIGAAEGRSVMQLLRRYRGCPQIAVSPNDMQVYLAKINEMDVSTQAVEHSSDAGTRASFTTAFEALSPGVEQQLAGLWQEVLGRSELGALDNFFELGGHSLLLIRLGGKIRKEFGAALSLSSLFDRPTIREQAKMISEGSTASSSGVKSPITRVSRDALRRKD